jgi:hypothetical protein
MGWLLGILIVVAICVFLVYSWIDSRVSLDYARQELKYQRREIEVLQSLLLETGRRMSRAEIEQLVTKHLEKDHLIKRDEPDELSINNIILKFKGDSLVDVKSLSE